MQEQSAGTKSYVVEEVEKESSDSPEGLFVEDGGRGSGEDEGEDTSEGGPCGYKQRLRTTIQTGTEK